MSYQNRAYGYVYTDREEGYIPYEDINIIKRYNIDDRDMYLDRGNREALKVLRDYILVPGDVLVIKNIQALGTNKKFIKEYLRYLYSNSIGVYFIENNELNVNLALEEKMSLIEATLIEIEREKKRQATIVGINNMPVNEYGVKYSGCTVHYVNSKVDGGAILLQEAVPVYFEDNAETLQKRILEKEHILLPKAIKLISEGKVEFVNNKIKIND